MKTTGIKSYAAGTIVSAEKSRAELDTILSRHGATNRGIQCDDERGIAMAAFVINGHKYRIDIPMPVLTMDLPATERPRGWADWTSARRSEYVAKHWQQACRERWRTLVLTVKAKLEIARLGVSSIEREFLADLVLIGGDTMHQHVGAMLEQAARGIGDGRMMLALPEMTATRRT